MRKNDAIATLLTLNEALENRFDLLLTGYSVPDAVRDYVEHNEALIALELLIVQICEFSINISKNEYQTLYDLAAWYCIQDHKALIFIKDKLLI